MDKHDYRAQPPDADMAPDASRTSAVRPFVRTWMRLNGRLVPLIGENGFVALFGRTLRLVVPAHPCLSVDGTRKTGAALLASLEADLDKVDHASAAAANEALMSTFTRQLSALIGPGLTERLLESTAGDEQQQIQQEHK